MYVETMRLGTEMDEPELEKPNTKVVTYWRVRGLISLAVLVPVGLVAIPASFLPSLWWLGPSVVLLGLLWLTGILVLSHKRYERLRFHASEELLLLQRGVLIHQQLVIPISRMQHIDTEHGPLERAFGLASLAVFTAGGMAATVRIPGLTPERAAELREHLLKHRDGAT